MSLTDLILKQLPIVVTFCLAGAIFLTAVALLIVARVQRAQAQRAVRRKRPAGNRAARELPDDLEVAVQARPVDEEAPEASQSLPAARRRAPSQSRQLAPERHPTETTTETPSEEATPPAEDQPQAASSGVQEILSGVFGEDELINQYEILLAGIPVVEIEALATLCDRVAQQLHSGR